MEKDKQRFKWIYILPEMGCMVFTALSIYIISLFTNNHTAESLSHIVMAVMGIAVTGFQFRSRFLVQDLDYDNKEHFYRFWLCFFCGIVVALICIFLPVSGWPFLPLFVLLSLFSNMNTGILAATALLTIPVIGSNASINVFLLYFISGVFAVTLFQNMEHDFKIGIPLFLSLLCLFVCETAVVVLPANARLHFELFVIPAANVIISCLLIVGIIKLFSALVVYKYRMKYLELNDSENQLLSSMKETNRDEYFHSIHTAYFCERIATSLSLDVEALKCAGYYYRWGEHLKELLEEQEFPPKAAEIITEYMQKNFLHKETAVLICSDMVISTVMMIHNKSQEKQIHYEQIIDAVFKRLEEKNTFRKCDITVRELDIMHHIFKEEKLYYDFLR